MVANATTGPKLSYGQELIKRDYSATRRHKRHKEGRRLRAGEEAFDVLADDIDFEIDLVAGF